MLAKIKWMDMDVEVCGNFIPATPAPKCSNPDRPSFADDGTPAETEIKSAWFVGRAGTIALRGALLDQLREDSDLPRLLGLEK